MSEIKKNIETCRGEDVLAEVSGLPQDPHFGSLVNEALDPLKQQALHQAGYDGYSEVIAQHKPYTFASAIIQMKSNLLLLLRALWQFPFGAGSLRSLSDDASLRSLSDDASLRSLADMWQHYITRLSGNETYGIPSRLSSLTDLPSAPLLVADRKISEPNAIDGISLANLLCGSYASLDGIEDSNDGWVYNKAFPWSIFPNVKKLTLRCKAIRTHVANGRTNLTELNLPNAEEINAKTYGYGRIILLSDNTVIERLALPKCKTISSDTSYSSSPTDALVKNNTALKVFDTPALEVLSPEGSALSGWVQHVILQNNSNLVEWNAPNLTQVKSTGIILNCVNLIKIVVGPVNTSFNIAGWSPTNALDASRTDLIEEGSTAQNNLDQFLQNFRTYIALRLADNGSGLTLTLSQAVFSSIWDANGNPQVLQDGLDQLRADIHNIVKTTKHWDVNKAN